MVAWYVSPVVGHGLVLRYVTGKVDKVLGEEGNRRWGPLLSEIDWDICLSKNGFSGVEFSLGNHQDAPQREGSAKISTAIEAEETVIPPLNAVITKVGSSAFEDEMINKLTSKLKTTLCVDSRLYDVLECLSIDLRQSVCVFLTSSSSRFFTASPKLHIVAYRR